jgi:hypothetical protein
VDKRYVVQESGAFISSIVEFEDDYLTVNQFGYRPPGLFCRHGSTFGLMRGDAIQIPAVSEFAGIPLPSAWKDEP